MSYVIMIQVRDRQRLLGKYPRSMFYTVQKTEKYSSELII